MSVEIRLTHSSYSVSVTRGQIQTLKGSLLAQAVGSDTEVVLDNPLVKLDYLNLLAMMARQEEIKALPPDKDLRKAAVYLNWPLLSVIQNPKYIQMQAFAPYCNLYHPETYGSVLPWSIAINFPMLTRHILQMTDSTRLDNQSLGVAVMYGRLEPVKMLLARGADPSVNRDRQALLVWSSFSGPENWSIIPEYNYAEYDVNEVKSHPIVWMSVWRCRDKCEHSFELMQLLFTCPSLQQGGYLSEIMMEVISSDSQETVSPRLIKMLQTQTQFDPNEMCLSHGRRETPLVIAYKWRRPQALHLLAADPRCQIPETLRAKLLAWTLGTQPDGDIDAELGACGQWCQK
jgi:hypothetical protein